MSVKQINAYCFATQADALFLSRGDDREIIQQETEKNFHSLPFELKYGKCHQQGHSETLSKRICDSLAAIAYCRSDDPTDGKELLSNSQKGHWEIWDKYRKSEKGVVVPFDEGDEIYARDPRADVVEDGIVGIDFGTRSTVVACAGRDERPHVIRIDVNDLRKDVERRHYENPTVLRFYDMRHFLETYKAKDGRPYTHWNDMPSAYSAQSRLRDLQNTTDVGHFFYDLKQWAAGNERKGEFVFRDSKGNRFNLGSYSHDDGAFDPIELYAYHIGLAINNQQRNRIYLNYLLSCPCSFSTELREKLRRSFERGIRKSLPQSLLDDEEVMKGFSVKIGATEPQAYATSALLSKKIFDARVCYGVFDFGGGTTDFDFGVWREADSAEKDRGFGRVLEHCRNGYDALLGGENILESRAFDVYRKNFSLMRENDWHIARPSESDLFPGCEMFTESDSEYARINLHMIAEALRPLWEQTDGAQQIEDWRKITVSLLDSKGILTTGQELDVDVEDFTASIRSRIRLSAERFLKLIENEFNEEKGKVYIFLAGNSSRSKLVQEVFQELIQNPPQGISFALEPPMEGADGREDVPTVKTGVALGLLRWSAGANILMLDHFVNSTNGPVFPYYVGVDDGCGRLKVLAAPGQSPAWIELQKVGRSEVALYYTTNPEAAMGDLSLDDRSVYRRVVELPKPDDASDWVLISICVDPYRIIISNGIEEKGKIKSTHRNEKTFLLK